MTGRRLTAYLALEREMLALDACGDPLADRLRDAMDLLWYALTDGEHATLDARVVIPEPGALLTVATSCFISLPESHELTPRAEPLRVTGWQCAV